MLLSFWLQVTRIVSEGKDPAFWNRDYCPFFSLPNGKVSCYADQAIQALNVLFENDGVYDEKKLIDHFLDYFGNPDSPYQVSLGKRKNKKFPIEGRYLIDIKITREFFIPNCIVVWNYRQRYRVLQTIQMKVILL